MAAGARVPPPPAPSRRLLRGRQQLQAPPQRPPPHHPGSEPGPGPRRPRAARGMGPSWVRSTWPGHSLIVTFRPGSPASVRRPLAAVRPLPRWRPPRPPTPGPSWVRRRLGRALGPLPTPPAPRARSAGALSPQWFPSPKPEANAHPQEYPPGHLPSLLKPGEMVLARTPCAVTVHGRWGAADGTQAAASRGAKKLAGAVKFAVGIDCERQRGLVSVLLNL